MRNYIDPEMNIAMFEAENVVTQASAKTLANQFFSDTVAGTSTGGTGLTAATVAAGNIIDFTD